MSSFIKDTKHPETGEWEEAQWLDDLFGPHHYGVVFPSDAKRHKLDADVGSEVWGKNARRIAFDPDAMTLETREPEPAPDMPKQRPDPVFLAMDSFTGKHFREKQRAGGRCALYLSLATLILLVSIFFGLKGMLTEAQDDSLDAAWLLAFFAYAWWDTKHAKHDGLATGYLKSWNHILRIGKRRNKV